MGEQAINRDELAVIAVGGNLPGKNDSVTATFSAAIAQMPARGLHPVRVSRWWRSAAWPDPQNPPFYNGVIMARTAMPPAQTMAALHCLEATFGRLRDAPNAPRTLDLDLIAHGQTVQEGALTLPHPRAAERYFVMGPLAEIAPDWLHPVTGERADALAKKASIGRDAAPQ